MKDSDENKVFDRSFHPVESGSNDERLSSRRRHLLKGVALGLPAILTLPRSAAVQATSLRCDEKPPAQAPNTFNPGGTWLVKQVEVFTYTKGRQTIQVYQDKNSNWRVYDTGASPPSRFPTGWTQGSSQFQSALAYYDTGGTCLWYGPGNTIGGTPTAASCYNSLHPGVTPMCGP